MINIKNITRTVRQLGYPSKNQLYEWINHRESSNGAFPEISSDGIRKKKVTISYDKILFALEDKLAILKRCFEVVLSLILVLNIHINL